MQSKTAKTLNPAQVRAYIEANSPACPYCGSVQIEGNCTGDEERQQEYSCAACGEEWDEIYLLSGLTDGRDGILVRPALIPVHAAAPEMRSALEKIGALIDNPCDPLSMLRKISRIQEAGLAWNGSFENLSEEHQTTAQGQRIEAVNAKLLAALEKMHWLYAPQATLDQSVNGEVMQTQGGLAVEEARAAIAQARTGKP